MLRAWLLASLVLGLPLSGCVGGSGSGAGDTGAPQSADPAEFDDTTGAITGLITDDEIQAIAGATIAVLDQPEAVTLSDVTGHFTLSRLVPGKVRLAAQALGYESTVRLVEVVAGAVTEVQLQLAPVPVEAPYSEFRPFGGYISCGAALVRTTYPLNCPGTAGTTKNFHELYTEKGWPKSWNATVIEAKWNAQAQPDWLAFDYNDRSIGYFGVYYRYRGTSPAHFVIERCGNYMAENFGRAPVPCTDEQVTASKMHIETFYVGKYQQETHTFDAACRDNLTAPVAGTVYPGYQAGCYGVGAALELRWDNYVTIFHHAAPADLHSFSSLPDG